MEYERSLFRIYDVILKQRSISYTFRIITVFCVLLGSLQLISLLLFHKLYESNGQVFSHSFAEELLGNCNSYNSSEFNLTLPIEDRDSCDHNNATKLLPEDIYVIRIENYHYEFSFHRESMSLSAAIRERKGFNTHNVTIERENLMIDSL